MSSAARRHAGLTTWLRSLTSGPGPDPARQGGCGCDYRPVAERGGRRIVEHKPDCEIWNTGIPVRLIIGDGDPQLIGTIRMEGDAADPEVGLGLFMQEWAAAYLTQLAAMGRDVRKKWIR